ncbi:MAG: aminodeoxychorismate synthase component I, partial [Aurantimicrobium sp.]|nr:aminodeoxychorismate synthase component I [Aurantimicrobium sp.]
VTPPAVRTHVPEWCDPELVFLAHARNRAQASPGVWPDLVWLDAGPDAREGFSYVGIDVGPPLNTWGDVRAAVHTPPRDSGQQSSADHRFALGWVGWLAYDAEACFSRVNTVIEFDHARREVTVVTSAGEDATARALQTIDDAQETGQPVAAGHDLSLQRPRGAWRHSDAAYRANVEACRTEIAAGNAYQLCLTNSYLVEAPFDLPEALAVYRRLRRDNPSHHGAFMCLNQTALLSSSPEVFLSISASGRAVTKPIKGTRPRGARPQSDRALRDELENNVKERAENVMIVDLMRNDLSRVAREGSVAVDTLLAVESYANVHQLVSTVSAQLRPECTAADAVEACFPAGSMTGAPKISAMRILAELEGGDRGIYSGAYGFFGDDGAAELAVVIRSLVIEPAGARLGSGGGITIDSEPEAELAEMHLKAEPLLRALGQADTPVI